MSEIGQIQSLSTGKFSGTLEGSDQLRIAPCVDCICMEPLQAS